MVDFNNPTVVTITLTSDMADFQLAGKLGWQDAVSLTYLPPYDTTQDKVADGVAELLNDIGVVPYDNLAVMEDMRDRVEKLKTNAVSKVADVLKKANSVNFNATTLEDGVNILTVDITIANRVDRPGVVNFLAEE